MTTESDFKSALKEMGFKEKRENSSFTWSLVHFEYGIINYNGGLIWINRLSKDMRNLAKLENKSGRDPSNEKIEKERLYRKTLSDMRCMTGIRESDIAFHFRKSGGDYVGISDTVDVKILMKLLDTLISK